MFVPAKRIPIHPSRVLNLQLDERFEIDSGLGGSFTVRFDGYRCNKERADFVIVSSSPPPDGWRNEHRSFPTSSLAATLYGHAPETPWFDDGKQELATLRHLGYPEDSPEIQTLHRRCPKLQA